MIELTEKTESKLSFKAKSEGIGKIVIDAIDAGNIVKSKTIYYIVKPITLDLEYDSEAELYKGDTLNVKINTNADSYNVIFDSDILEVETPSLELNDSNSGANDSSNSANVKVKLLEPHETNAIFQVIRNNTVIHDKPINLKINDIVLEVIYDPIHVRINDNFSFEVKTKGADRFNVSADSSTRLISNSNNIITLRPTKAGQGRVEVQAIKNGIVEKSHTVNYIADDIYIRAIHGILDVQENDNFKFSVETNADHFEAKLNSKLNKLVEKTDDYVEVQALQEGVGSIIVEAYQMIDDNDTLMTKTEVPFIVDKEGQRYDFYVGADGENIDLFKGIELDDQDYLIYINDEISSFSIKNLSFKENDHIVIRKSRSNSNSLFPLIQNTKYIKKFEILPPSSLDMRNPVIDLTSLFENSIIEEVRGTLFKYNPQVNVFDNVFYNSKLKYIPEDIFKYNTNAYSFKSSFERCYDLTSIPENIFKEQEINKNSNSMNFTSTFLECTNVTGKLPALWNTFKTYKHAYCFGSCTKAENYILAEQNKWVD